MMIFIINAHIICKYPRYSLFLTYMRISPTESEWLMPFFPRFSEFRIFMKIFPGFYNNYSFSDIKQKAVEVPYSQRLPAF